MTRLVVAILLIACTKGVADDWTMGGRNSRRNPVTHEKNPITDIAFESVDSKEKNIRWKVKLGSRSIGGPIVANGLVWIGMNNDEPFNREIKGDASVLACFRASDGRFMYQYVSPRLDRPQWNDWPTQSLSGSPIIENDRLWFCNNRREVICLDIGPLHRGAESPKLLWRVDLIEEYGIQPVSLMVPGHDSHGSPAIYKDWLYVPTGHGVLWRDEPKDEYDPKAPHLVCLDKNTGKLVWKDASPAKNAMYGHFSSPTILDDVKPAQVVLPQSDGWVRSFDAATGELVWKFDTNLKNAVWTGGPTRANRTAKLYPIATPVYAEGRVYVSTGFFPEASLGNDGTLFCLDPTRKGDISRELDHRLGQVMKNTNSGLIWAYTDTQDEKKKKMELHRCLGSVAVHQGLVFVVDSASVVHCLDAQTGNSNWFHDTRVGTYSRPLIVDDKLFVGTDDTIHIFNAAPTKKHIAGVEINRTIVAGPVYANGNLYILAEGWLFALGGNPSKE